MEHSSNLFIIVIITVMQMLSRVVSDCPVHETLDVLRDNPMLEKYRSICDHLRNVTFPTIDETSYNKSEAYCVKEFERHYSDLTNYIRLSCSLYSMGTTYPDVELSKTSTLNPYTPLPIDETDNTTKSTTIIHNLTTGNKSDVSAGIKESLLSTTMATFADNRSTVSTTVIGEVTISNKTDINDSTKIFLLNTLTTAFADNRTIVSTTVIGNFTTGNDSDISDSTNKSLLSTPVTAFADNSTTVSTTVLSYFTTDNESDISDSTKRSLLSTPMTAFAENSTTVSTTVFNDFTAGNDSDISDSTKRSLLITSMTAFADNRTTVSTKLIINFTTGNESNITDSTEKSLLSTPMTAFADTSTTVSTTVAGNFTTNNESDIGNSTKRPLLRASLLTIADDHIAVSTLADKDLTTDKSDQSDGTKFLRTTTRLSSLGKNIETKRTRTTQKITPKEAGISTLYALLLFFTALTLGIIVIITVLIVYKKFRTGSYEPEAGLHDTNMELEDSL